MGDWSLLLGVASLFVTIIIATGGAFLTLCMFGIGIFVNSIRNAVNEEKSDRKAGTAVLHKKVDALECEIKNNRESRRNEEKKILEQLSLLRQDVANINGKLEARFHETVT